MSIHLPPLLSDGMVLQRGAEVQLWGTLDEPVSVTFLDRQYHATPDATGGWSVTLSALAPGEQHLLTINAYGEKMPPSPYEIIIKS